MTWERLAVVHDGLGVGGWSKAGDEFRGRRGTGNAGLADLEHSGYLPSDVTDALIASW